MLKLDTTNLKKMKKKNTSIPMSNIKIVESGKTDNPNKNT
jgi:hypothetical protein